MKVFAKVCISARYLCSFSIADVVHGPVHVNLGPREKLLQALQLDLSTSKHLLGSADC